ncbi:MAG: hypothetical protein WC879_12335 [Melioribacteraceae bacterium]
MTFELLLVCKLSLPYGEFKELLNEKLIQVLADNLNEFDDSTVESFIKINYARKCDIESIAPLESKRIIWGIRLDLPEEVENAEIVIEEFCSNIIDIEQIEHAVKYEDEVLITKNQQYFQEIFYLEMKLRRVISMIYLNRYSDNYFSLLREEITKPTSKEPPTVDQMEKAFENEFFHLLFSQYVNLNSRKLPSKTDEFINLVKERYSFEDFLNELNRTPVTKKEDIDFLSGLKDKLDPIEKLRNCVAHNRKISEKLLQNYNEAKKLLEKDLDEYLSNYNTTSVNEITRTSEEKNSEERITNLNEEFNNNYEG